MQIYKNEAFYVTGVFLDIVFIECVWVHLRRNHTNSSMAMQLTGIWHVIVYFGFDFIMLLLLLMNLHKIQLPVKWQIECFNLYTMQHILLELWTI